MRLDLSEFPDNPPRKWVLRKVNRVQLTLVLIEIDAFQMKGWSLNNLGELTFERCDENILVKFTGEALLINCTARFLDVEKIAGYHDSEAAVT